MENISTDGTIGNPTPQFVPQGYQGAGMVGVPVQPLAGKPKMATWKKTIIIICGIVLGIIAIAAIIILIVSATSKKYECTSSQGDITLMYDEKTIKGYFANGITYDLDTQKTYAELMGVESYLAEFNEWFKANTDGYCVKK